MKKIDFDKAKEIYSQIKNLRREINEISLQIKDLQENSSVSTNIHIRTTMTTPIIIDISLFPNDKLIALCQKQKQTYEKKIEELEREFERI